jgi:hypothetical protein
MLFQELIYLNHLNLIYLILDVEEVQETKPFDPFSSALPPTPMPEWRSNTNSSGSGSRDHESGVDA